MARKPEYAERMSTGTYRLPREQIDFLKQIGAERGASAALREVLAKEMERRSARAKRRSAKGGAPERPS